MSCHQSGDAVTQFGLRIHANGQGWAPTVFPAGRQTLLDDATPFRRGLRLAASRRRIGRRSPPLLAPEVRLEESRAKFEVVHRASSATRGLLETWARSAALRWIKFHSPIHSRVPRM